MHLLGGARFCLIVLQRVTLCKVEYIKKLDVRSISSFYGHLGADCVVGCVFELIQRVIPSIYFFIDPSFLPDKDHVVIPGAMGGEFQRITHILSHHTPKSAMPIFNPIPWGQSFPTASTYRDFLHGHLSLLFVKNELKRTAAAIETQSSYNFKVLKKHIEIDIMFTKQQDSCGFVLKYFEGIEMSYLFLKKKRSRFLIITNTVFRVLSVGLGSIIGLMVLIVGYLSVGVLLTAIYSTFAGGLDEYPFSLILWGPLMLVALLASAYIEYSTQRNRGYRFRWHVIPVTYGIALWTTLPIWMYWFSLVSSVIGLEWISQKFFVYRFTSLGIVFLVTITITLSYGAYVLYNRLRKKQSI